MKQSNVDPKILQRLRKWQHRGPWEGVGRKQGTTEVGSSVHFSFMYLFSSFLILTTPIALTFILKILGIIGDVLSHPSLLDKLMDEASWSLTERCHNKIN